VGNIASHFLTSALDGDEWSASCPCRFTSEIRAHGTLWIPDHLYLKLHYLVSDPLEQLIAELIYIILGFNKFSRVYGAEVCIQKYFAERGSGKVTHFAREEHKYSAVTFYARMLS
jgi:hypothetical protein